MRTDILERKEEILSWITEELPLCEIRARLKCKAETLRTYLKKMGIEYKGQQAKKGQQKGPLKYRPSSYYTYKGAPAIPSYRLKLKLIRDGIKSDACELCGNSEWLGKKLPLELHHIDGDHFNNELANLQILCPNCHAVIAPNSGASADKYGKKRLRSDNTIVSKKQEKALRKEQAIKNGAPVDALGRVNSRILSEDDWSARRDSIINSRVDLTKFGWKTKVQEITGLTRRQVDLTLEHFIDYFKDKIYIYRINN